MRNMWISTAKSVPADGETVLAWLRDGSGSVEKMEYEDGWWRNLDREQVAYAHGDPGAPSHWMPLPQAPE